MKFSDLYTWVQGVALDLVSPTRWVMRQYLRRKAFTPDSAEKGSVLSAYNLWCFRGAVMILIAVAVLDHVLRIPDFPDALGWHVLLYSFIWLVPGSRAVEVFLAFFKDALDRLGNPSFTSHLDVSTRIKMAFRSYAEIVIHFAVIYYLLPHTHFNHEFRSVEEAVYFSGMTIATVGYGDITPASGFAQLLVVLQVACGLVLLLVAFAIYTSRSSPEPQTTALRAPSSPSVAMLSGPRRRRVAPRIRGTVPRGRSGS